MATFREKIKENLITLTLTTTIALITIFSDKIVGRIKFAVNRANLRIEHYEKLAVDISNYTFAAENVTEYYDQGWTELSSLKTVVPPYNDAIVSLRKQEYVTLALLYRYWDENDATRFKNIMKTVREIDFHIHSMNSEAEAIVTGVKKKADITVTKPITKKLKVLLATLKAEINDFLSELF